MSAADQSIKHWVAVNQDRIIRTVSELVRYRTVNEVTKGNESMCQHHVARVLQDMGLAVDLYSPEDVEGFRLHPAYFPGKDYSDRPNVTGTWEGRGGGKSLVLSSHIDTAVVTRGWDRDPFDPWVADGRLYGLGSFDMKGGLSASFMAVQCLMDLGMRPKGDVMIESVVDEEFGGANGTLAGRLRGPRADLAIVPEPTNLAVCPAHHGGALWRVTFRGTTGLSFSGESIRNPANDAARFIVHLEKFEEERAQTPSAAPWYEGPQRLPVIVTRVEAGDMQASLCDVGPTECHVDIWVECLPGVAEEALMRDILAGFASANPPEFRKVIRFLPGSHVSPEFPFVAELARIVEKVTGSAPPVQGAPFACDAFLFNLYSPTPAIILGPAGGNAHAPGEYVGIESLCRLVEIYARAIVKWCGED